MSKQQDVVVVFVPVADKPYQCPGATEGVKMTFALVERGTESGLPTVIIDMTNEQGVRTVVEMTWRQFATAFLAMNTKAADFWPTKDKNKFFTDLN